MASEGLKPVKSEMLLQGVPAPGATTSPECSASELSGSTFGVRAAEASTSTSGSFSARFSELTDYVSNSAHSLRTKVGEAADGVRSSIRAVPAAVEAKATPVVQAVRARVAVAVETAEAVRSKGLWAIASDAVQEISAATASVTAAIRNKVNDTNTAIYGRYEQLSSGVTAARGFAADTYKDFRTKGVKTFAYSMAQDTQALVAVVTSNAWSGALQSYSAGKAYASNALTTTQLKAVEAADFTKIKASEISATVVETMKDGRFQATTASAVGGAVALGASGGAAGWAAGTVVGAAIGVVPALFTFGLSIPIGAAIGGGAGLAVGTTVGGAVGAVGGGTAGYGVYSKRTELKDGAGEAWGKVLGGAEYVRSKAKESAGYVAQRASVVRQRLSGGGTGGTECQD